MLAVMAYAPKMAELTGFQAAHCSDEDFLLAVSSWPKIGIEL
jgi:hypothetical protein